MNDYRPRLTIFETMILIWALEEYANQAANHATHAATQKFAQNLVKEAETAASIRKRLTVMISSSDFTDSKQAQLEHAISVASVNVTSRFG